MDEQHFAEIDATLMYIEDARARAERAAAELRKGDAETHLIAALERAMAELSANPEDASPEDALRGTGRADELRIANRGPFQ